MDTTTPDTSPGPDPERPWWRQYRWMAALAVAAVAAVALASVTGGTDDRPAAAAAGGTAAGPEGEDEGAPADECSRAATPEDVATMQADEDALAAYLDELGIEHRMVDLGVLGVRTVEWDTADPAANEAVEDIWVHRDPLSPTDVAVYNEQQDALAAHLDAVGIAYTVDTAPDGARTVQWDYDDPAAEAAVDEWSTSMTPPEEDTTPDDAGC